MVQVWERMEVPRPVIREFLLRLRDGEAVLREEIFVGRHQPRLADGGARLQLREFLGARLKSQHAHARADRARGDEHDLAAGLALRGHLRDELLHLREIEKIATGIASIGGAGTFFGPALGAAVMTFFARVSSDLTRSWLLYQGLVFVLIMLLFFYFRFHALPTCTSVW